MLDIKGVKGSWDVVGSKLPIGRARIAGYGLRNQPFK